MKTLVCFLICFASSSITLLVRHTLSVIAENQELSRAGQTLQSLSQSLEEVKLIYGEYPDSITGLIFETENGDFSHEVLLKTQYFRTDSGYIAFVGRPSVSYIFPRVSARHE